MHFESIYVHLCFSLKCIEPTIKWKNTLLKAIIVVTAKAPPKKVSQRSNTAGLWQKSRHIRIQ